MVRYTSSQACLGLVQGMQPIVIHQTLWAGRKLATHLLLSESPEGMDSPLDLTPVCEPMTRICRVMHHIKTATSSNRDSPGNALAIHKIFSPTLSFAVAADLSCPPSGLQT
jgi:hypothetical protein